MKPINTEVGPIHRIESRDLYPTELFASKLELRRGHESSLGSEIGRVRDGSANGPNRESSTCTVYPNVRSEREMLVGVRTVWVSVPPSGPGSGGSGRATRLAAGGGPTPNAGKESHDEGGGVELDSNHRGDSR